MELSYAHGSYSLTYFLVFVHFSWFRVDLVIIHAGCSVVLGHFICILAMLSVLLPVFSR